MLRRDRDYVATGLRFCGGALMAISCKFKSHRRRDLETCDECVWLEITLRDRCGLIGNYSFPPKSQYQPFISHLNALTIKIDFSKYRVQIYGDFQLLGVVSADLILLIALEKSRPLGYLR